MRGLLSRRDALGLVALLCGCEPPAPPPQPQPVPEPPPLPDRMVGPLSTLLTFPRLRWLLALRPERLAKIEWLRVPMARLIKDERLDDLGRATGVDLREVPELVLAGYDDDADGSVMWLVRHRRDPLLIERKFRERLTGNESRGELGHQLIGVWGTIGTSTRGFVAIGRDVAGYQYGGDPKRGPARIALLYAQGKLASVPTSLAEPTLLHLDQQLGLEAAKIIIPGPFEGDAARGLRGLMAGADAIGASLGPTETRHLRLSAIVAGDYGDTSERQRAVELLQAAWDDLGKSDLGHLLGMHQPIAPPEVAASPTGLSLRVDLDATALFRGLSAATVDDVREIMR